MLLPAAAALVLSGLAAGCSATTFASDAKSAFPSQTTSLNNALLFWGNSADQLAKAARADRA